MGELSALGRWAGTWRGENRLWVNGEAARVSTIHLVASTVDAGRAAHVSYVWDYEGAAQDGMLVFKADATDGRVNALWKDTWHTGETGMVFKGGLGEDGAADLLASYPAPPDEAWGWRITLGAEGDGMAVRMFNISPAGESALAVEAVCIRE